MIRQGVDVAALADIPLSAEALILTTDVPEAQVAALKAAWKVQLVLDFRGNLPFHEEQERKRKFMSGLKPGFHTNITLFNWDVPKNAYVSLPPDQFVAGVEFVKDRSQRWGKVESLKVGLDFAGEHSHYYQTFRKASDELDHMGLFTLNTGSSTFPEIL
jgi:hypothetical protein